MNNYKKIILLLALAGTFTIAHAQILHPVKWAYAAKRTAKGEAVVYLKATIDDGWHIYSTVQPDGGPDKTAFTFTPSKVYSLQGTIIEPTPIKHFEHAFNMDVFYFEQSVVFSQRLKVAAGPIRIKGTVTYMTCNDQKCLPPETLDFSIPLK